ncbi:MAG: type VI secretion system tip protein VgrG [Leptolyngbya sp. SIO1D8]|nr:type VI secretion system tip protein VgrG [Leptolyngbya sp. SIO1D8]
MPSVVTATIASVEGLVETPMDPQYNLLAIDIIKEVNKVPTAQLILLDGDAAQQKFAISDTDFFKPGKKIKIQLRYEGEPDTTVFIGFVVKHCLQATRKKSILTLYLKDAAIKLTQERKNAIFRDKDDIAIIKELINTVITKDQKSNVTDLKLGDFAPKKTAIAHPEMVQYYCSDWDFILTRAEANGLWVLVNDGVMSVQAPDLIKGKETALVYGLDEIYDLEVEADIREQFQSVKAISWDGQEQTLIKPQTGDEYVLEQKDLDPATLGKIIGADQCQLVSGAELDTKEMKAWATAKIIKNRLSMLKGRVQIPGRADLQLGGKLTLEKFGKRFNGSTLITGIRHQISEGGWQTDIQFGASATPFAPSDDIMKSPASGLLPAVNGLQVGVVNDLAVDPTGKLRVQVQVPRLTPTSETPPSDKNDGLVWARLATLEAGLTADESQGRGTVFRPETGDEVVLGFLNDDPRQAIILGALHSEKNKSPIPITEENTQRGIFTKENLKLYFDDKDKSIRIETPNTNRIILIDEDGAIYIVDENNNQLTMNSDGIQMSSDSDITIKAKGNITLEGQQVDVK